MIIDCGMGLSLIGIIDCKVIKLVSLDLSRKFIGCFRLFRLIGRIMVRGMKLIYG